MYISKATIDQQRTSMFTEPQLNMRGGRIHDTKVMNSRSNWEFKNFWEVFQLQTLFPPPSASPAANECLNKMPLQNVSQK